MKHVTINPYKLSDEEKKEFEPWLNILEGVANLVYPRLLEYDEKQERLLTREEIFITLDANIETLLTVLQKSQFTEMIRESLIDHYYSQRKEKYVE